jgi:hypothetical protein
VPLAAALESFAIALAVRTPPLTVPNVADGTRVESSVPLGLAVLSGAEPV